MAEHKVRETQYSGVTFASFREFLFYMYFWYEGMEKEEAKECLNLIVPMMHSIDNPMNPSLQELNGKKFSDDTYIQYWIDMDDRYTQDFNHNGAGTGANTTMVKLADVSIRFVGYQAETWAKAWHHLTKRDIVHAYLHDLCEGEFLEYISPIIPVNVDYFVVGNSTIAFDVSCKVKYKETIVLRWKPLELVVTAPGEIEIEGEVQT